MKKWQSISVGVIVSIIILGAAGAFFLYRILHSSLPAYNGVIKLYSLDDNVEIYRDEYSIPYIFAATDEDAAFALGYVHAQERLFQMDIMRRAAEGRLSEIFGEKTLQYDKMFLTMGIKKSVKDNYNNYSDTTKRLLRAYSNGVNEYLRKNKGKLSLEFDMLKYEPYEWKPEHSLMIIKMLAWEMNISLWTDVAYAHLIQKIGVDKAKEIIPDFFENEATIIPSEIKNFASVESSIIQTDREFRKFLGINGSHIGSNNWVVNGVKSASGKPIIANDPHLTLQAPGKWYAAVLKNDKWNVAGVTIPGVPVIVIGKNDNISWVLTNVMADDADFYNEMLDSLGNKYLFNGNWCALSEYEEKIMVKDYGEVRFKIRSTHRGPIVTDIHPYNFLFQKKIKNSAVFSMKWQANQFSDEFLAMYKMNKAENWNNFLEAVSGFTVPGQNFVYADKEGNIGYICGVKLPARKVNNPTFLNDGTNDKNDWSGYVPFEEMPKLFNPPENFIASANNKTVKDFKYHISNIWEPTSRIDRIKEMLTSKEKHSVEDFMRYQNDFVSKYAASVTPYILNAFRDSKIYDKNLKTVLNLFKDWNYELGAKEQLPAIYEVFLHRLLKNIFYDKLGEELYNEYVFAANIPYRTLLNLLPKNESHWFDLTKTPNIETRDETIRKSLTEALNELEKYFGYEIKNWQWGNLHNIIFKHLFSGTFTFLDEYTDIGPFAIGGDGTTVFNTEYSFCINGSEPELSTKRFDNVLGPSMRFIYDFGSPDEFYLALTTGESGYIFSPHYKDMTPLWYEGKYIKVHTDEYSIRKLNKKLLLAKY